MKVFERVKEISEPMTIVVDGRIPSIFCRKEGFSLNISVIVNAIISFVELDT